MKYFLTFLSFCFVLLFSCQSSDKKSSQVSDTLAPVDTGVVSKMKSSSQASGPRVEVKGTSVWQGTINSKIEMTLTLTFNNNVIYGNVVYKKSGIPITVIGYRDEQNNLRLQEYYKSSAITGIYSGLIKSEDSISGNWYGGNYEKEMGFKIKRKETLSESVPEFKEDITGNYGFRYGENGAVGGLNVGLKDDSVIYNFQCVTHGPAFNIAQMMATSKLDHNHAKYKVKDENDLCEFDIFFVPGGAVVRHAEDGWQCGFGLNASVDGLYFKEDNKQTDFEKIRKTFY